MAARGGPWETDKGDRKGRRYDATAQSSRYDLNPLTLYRLSNNPAGMSFAGEEGTQRFNPLCRDSNEQPS